MPHKLLKSHNFTPHYFNIYFLIEFKFYSIIKSMVLKTEPDRPVQPIELGTGTWSGPVPLKNRKLRKKL